MVKELFSKFHKISKVKDLKTSIGKLINPNDIPNGFNEHFVKLGPGLSSIIPDTNIPPESYLKEEIEKCLNGRFLSYFNQVDQLDV